LASVEIARFEVDRHGGNESGLLRPPCVGVAERCRGLCFIHHNGLGQLNLGDDWVGGSLRCSRDTRVVSKELERFSCTGPSHAWMSGLTYMECAQSPKKVGDDIAKCTKAWKGMNVTVKLTCQNRQAAVSLVPTASSLVVRTPNPGYARN